MNSIQKLHFTLMGSTKFSMKFRGDLVHFTDQTSSIFTQYPNQHVLGNAFNAIHSLFQEKNLSFKSLKKHFWKKIIF